jgi:predicted nucleic acid-binding protein
MELVDADVLIDIQRKHPPAVAWFSGLAKLPAVPGFAVMELIQAAQNRRQVQAVWQLVAGMQTVWATNADCNRALSDFAAYRLSHGLGLVDALIAACAVGYSATLYNFNAKHYQVVPHLIIAKPYTR